MDQVFEWLAVLVAAVSELTPLQQDAIETAGILVVLLLVRAAVLYVVRRRTTVGVLRYRWRKSVTYITGFLGVFLIAWVWFEGVGAIATVLGLVGAGLVIALKDTVANFTGWLFLIWRRPFVVGDRIQIDKHAGDVVDIRLFQFTILEIGNWVEADQSTGRLIHVPNGRVFIDPVANYTRGFPYIWNEVPVTITFESDWEAAKELLLEIARRHGSPMSEDAEREVLAASRSFLIFYSTLTPTVYTSVVESGVRLTARYICEARRRRGTEEAIWEDVLRAFAGRDDIEFAYPTRRYYDRTRQPERTPAEPGAGDRPAAS